MTLQALSLVALGDEPPTEFRLFAAGANETTKGTFIFDANAAASVLAEYEKHGIELAMDYDHAMLAGGLDPAEAGKAAAWFGLEVRCGELWAVNVRWTPAAAEALRAKEWRYFSPAFNHDGAGRILSLINVALTNLPATRNLEPLMAANDKKPEDENTDKPAAGATPEKQSATPTLQDALAALEAKDVDAAMEIIAALIDAEGEAEKPAPEQPAKKPLAPEQPAKKPAPNAPDAPDETTAKLMSITGKKTIAGALAEISRLQTDLESTRVRLAAEQSAAETRKRMQLCRDLVVMGGRSPASVWIDVLADSPQPRSAYASMPLTALEQYVADAVRANPRKPKLVMPGPKVPSADMSTTGGRVFTIGQLTIDVTPDELEMCAKKKIDPRKYAETRAAMLARRAGS